MTPPQNVNDLLRVPEEQVWLYWSSFQSVNFEYHVLPTLAAPVPLLIQPLNQATSVLVKGSLEGGQQSNSDTHCPHLLAEMSCLVL